MPSHLQHANIVQKLFFGVARSVSFIVGDDLAQLLSVNVDFLQSLQRGVLQQKQGLGGLLKSRVLYCLFALFLNPPHHSHFDPFERVLKIGVVRQIHLPLDRVNHRQIYQVLQVCWGEVRCFLGDQIQVQVRFRLDSIHIVLEDLLPVLLKGKHDVNFEIESAGSRECRIQVLLQIGGPNHHHVVFGLKPVHFS